MSFFVDELPNGELWPIGGAAAGAPKTNVCAAVAVVAATGLLADAGEPNVIAEVVPPAPNIGMDAVVGAVVVDSLTIVAVVADFGDPNANVGIDWMVDGTIVEFEIVADFDPKLNAGVVIVVDVADDDMIATLVGC